MRDKVWDYSLNWYLKTPADIYCYGLEQNQVIQQKYSKILFSLHARLDLLSHNTIDCQIRTQ